MCAIYVTSPFDNNQYCLTNGQFTRHLKVNGYTYQQYYEHYVTGKIETCTYCGNPKKFYQATYIYAETCGKPSCRSNIIRNTKQNWTTEQRDTFIENKRLADSRRTQEEKLKILEKVKSTNLKKFGTEWSFKSDEIKTKAKQTKFNKYGNSNWNNSRKASISRINRSDTEKELTVAKRKKTNMDKYGIENTLLLPSNRTASGRGNGLVKPYILPSGIVIGVMRYEHIVLDKLLETYNESDIVVHDNYTNTVVDKIEYVAVNRHHLNYYPDIYIKSTNTIIEVKSRWWWDGNGNDKYKSRLENNRRKRDATISRGYKYEVWLFNNKYDYRILSNDSDF